MSKTLCCGRFDLYQLIAYRKSMLIFLLYPAFMAFFTGEAMSGVSFVGIMAMLTVGYVFSIEERYHTDQLPLPMDRKAKVRGRYLFTVGLLVAISLIGPIEGVVLSLVMNQSLDLPAAMGLWLGTLLVVLVMASLQLPIFFKMGYMKGRFVSLLPLLLCCLAVPFLMEFVQDERSRAFLEEKLGVVMANSLPLLLALAAAAAACLGISYLLSIRIYLRREL